MFPWYLWFSYGLAICENGIKYLTPGWALDGKYPGPSVLHRTLFWEPGDPMATGCWRPRSCRVPSWTLLSRSRAIPWCQNHQSASGWQFWDGGTCLERVCHQESWASAQREKRDSLVPRAQLEMGLRPILRISSHLVLSRAHRFGQRFSLGQCKSFFFFFSLVSVK